jgi:MarR family transcriptional regulator, organic hydroperoxide resistance regulator
VQYAVAVTSARLKTAATSPTRPVVRDLAQAFFELMIASSARFPAIADEFGISAGQAVTLFKIDLEREHTMSQVAQAAHCEPSNLTGIIDKLEARGLVERRGATNDRRIKMISLTREGVALRRRLIARLNEPAEWMLALSVEDQRRLRDIFRRALVAGERPERVAAGA